MQAAKQPKLDHNQLEQSTSSTQTQSEQFSPILSLPYDKIKLFLEYVNLNDLYSLGLTCKRLHQAAGEFYRENYPLEYFCIRKVKGKLIQQTNAMHETNFGCFAEELWIYGESANNMEYFRFMAKIKNTNLKRILFYNCADFTEDQGRCLADILKSVESVDFSNEKRSSRNLNEILRFCTNVRRLKVWSNSGAIEWPSQSYSTLERLDVYNKVAASGDRLNELKLFLQINPQITHFSIGTYANTNVRVIDVLQLFEDINMKLDNLELESDNFKKDDVMRINEFQTRGFCEQVQITCWGHRKNSFNNLHLITNLNVLKIQGRISDADCVANTMAKMENLKKLDLEHLASEEHAEILSKSISNVEVIHLRWGSLENALPFLQSLPNLECIQISPESFGIEYKIKQLNKARKKLLNAKKLTIELHPSVFLQFVKIQRVATKM